MSRMIDSLGNLIPDGLERLRFRPGPLALRELAAELGMDVTPWTPADVVGEFLEPLFAQASRYHALQRAMPEPSRTGLADQERELRNGGAR